MSLGSGPDMNVNIFLNSVKSEAKFQSALYFRPQLGRGTHLLLRIPLKSRG
jgi:hypothetical protein